MTQVFTPANQTKRILLVDDEISVLSAMGRILKKQGFDVLTASTGLEALEEVRQSSSEIHAILTDVRMPQMDGLELLKAVSLIAPGLPLILMSAHSRIEDAVWALKFGAVDFLVKPFDQKTLIETVRIALSRDRRALGSVSSRLLGQSPSIQKVHSDIQKLKGKEANVLILGESGTGKDIIAKEVHECSPRSSGPFQVINCGAIPASLIESELFGHEKGAFTGASQSQVGAFEAANGGTVFLDEIGEMPLDAQVKLLRVLQNGEVKRVGSNKTIQVNVRVIAATHRNLRELVAQGIFREDLLYRLNVYCIEVSPLRERKEDISLLFKTFLERFQKSQATEAQPIQVDSAVFALLEDYDWPGNVRQLENCAERALIVSEGDRIRETHLPPEILSERKMTSRAAREVRVPVGTSLREMELRLIEETLKATDGDKEAAAKLLGVNSRTIYRKIPKGTEAEAK